MNSELVATYSNSKPDLSGFDLRSTVAKLQFNIKFTCGMSLALSAEFMMCHRIFYNDVISTYSWLAYSLP